MEPRFWSYLSIVWSKKSSEEHSHVALFGGPTSL